MDDDDDVFLRGVKGDFNSVTKFPLQDCDLQRIPESVLIKVLDEGPVLHLHGDTKIVWVTKTVILKGGPSVDVSEAETMRFVASVTNIRLPKVYRYFSVKDEDTFFGARGYILMDYLEGTCLSECWSELEEGVKERVYQQVVNAIKEMQAVIVSQPGPIGGGKSKGMWFTDYGAGPFGSREDMENWFNHKLEFCKGAGQADPETPSFTGLFKPLVLSHMDISPRNLILDKNQDIWFIDWEFAGAYPVYFERAALLMQTHFRDFKKELLARLKGYNEEIKNLSQVWWGLTTAALV